MSLSKIFQISTRATITKCRWHGRQLLVRHVFVKKFKRISQFHMFFTNISTLYLC